MYIYISTLYLRIFVSFLGDILQEYLFHFGAVIFQLILSLLLQAYQLVREAGELAQWINDKEAVVLDEEVGDDLEQVEVIQRKFDDFQKDMKANEARLVELNTIAERLTAMGQTEAAEKIKIQIEDLNQRWAALQQVTQERSQTLGSAHEVQRYHRSGHLGCVDGLVQESGINLSMHPANEGRRYNVTSPIGWAHTQNDPLECGVSSALVMDLQQSCPKPLMWYT